MIVSSILPHGNRIEFSLVNMKIKFFHLFLLLTCFVFLEVSCTDDPYGILGIERKATLTEVKKAYKQLAKEW